MRNTSAEFVRLLERTTVIGQMAGSWLPAPPFTPILAFDGEPAGAFVGPGEPIPVANFPLRSLYDRDRQDSGRWSRSIRRRSPVSIRGRGGSLEQEAGLPGRGALEDREFLSTTALIPNEHPGGILADAPALGDLAALEAYVSGRESPIAPY